MLPSEDLKRLFVLLAKQIFGIAIARIGLQQILESPEGEHLNEEKRKPSEGI